MARTPGGTSGLLATGSNTIFTTADDSSSTITNLILTNLESKIGTCQIYIDRGTSRLVQIVKIPSGNGVAVSVNLLKGTTLDATDTLSITADKTNINYDFSEYTVT